MFGCILIMFFCRLLCIFAFTILLFFTLFSDESSESQLNEELVSNDEPQNDSMNKIAKLELENRKLKIQVGTNRILFKLNFTVFLIEIKLVQYFSPNAF